MSTVQRRGSFIQGVRDSISTANSATYRIEISSDGAYQLWARCWWQSGDDNFGVFFDESNTDDRGSRRLHAAPDALLHSWVLEKMPATLYLGKGTHTLRFFGRSAGSRIDWFMLGPPATSPAPAH